MGLFDPLENDPAAAGYEVDLTSVSLVEDSCAGRAIDTAKEERRDLDEVGFVTGYRDRPVGKVLDLEATRGPSVTRATGPGPA